MFATFPTMAPAVRSPITPGTGHLSPVKVHWEARDDFAVALVDGDVDLEDSDDNIDGHDAHPPGWEAAGVCTSGLEDGPGLVMKDTGELNDDGDIDGVPPLIEDPTISEATFMEFGPNKTWEDLKNQANHTVDQYTIHPAPSYTNGGTVCDTSDPENWGSPDPDDPCFDYFPIILIQDQVHAEDTYGQGILILDWNPGDGLGSEIDLEDGMVYNGIILGKGCLEIQRDAVLNGAAFMDGNYFNEDLCEGDKVLELNSDSMLQYSTCAIERAIKGAGLEGYSSSGGGYSLLATRAFAQLPR